MNLSEYDKQANDFLELTDTILKVEFLKHDTYFIGETKKRDIYKITLQRGQRKYVFEFGQSIVNSGKFKLYNKYSFNDIKNMRAFALKKGFGLDYDKNNNFKPPTAYTVLTAITKNDPETLQDFCDNFGYDTDSIKANKTYKAVLNEWKNVCSLWSDTEIEQLQEIQ